jgi:hypothetical protein
VIWFPRYYRQSADCKVSSLTFIAGIQPDMGCDVYPSAEDRLVVSTRARSKEGLPLLSAPKCQGAQAESRVEFIEQMLCRPGVIAGKMYQPEIGIDLLPALTGWHGVTAFS